MLLVWKMFIGQRQICPSQMPLWMKNGTETWETALVSPSSFMDIHSLAQ